MAIKLGIYKCELCGNMVEVVHQGGGELVCCGQPMRLMTENSTDASREKHVPVVERNADGVTVRVGSVPHPMEEKHYIEWIEIITPDGTQRRFLNPGEAPEAAFCVGAGDVAVREYCNVHGLWKA